MDTARNVRQVSPTYNNIQVSLFNTMRLPLTVLLLASLLPALVTARRPVKEYEINLDLDPGHRFDALLPDFNTTVWGFWEKLFANDAVLRDALFALSDLRGECCAAIEAELDFTLPLVSRCHRAS